MTTTAAPVGARSSRVLDFINQWLDKHPYPPTYREIMRGCGLSSTSHVDHHLNRLENAGLVRRDHFTPRAVVPVSRLADLPITAPAPAPELSTPHTWATFPNLKTCCRNCGMPMDYDQARFNTCELWTAAKRLIKF